MAIIAAYASPTTLADANAYSREYGLPPLTGATFQQVVAPGTFRHPERGQRQDPQGWCTEETLDVEAVHAVAPGARIVYVGAPNNFQDLDAAMNHVVDRHLASIVTNSYGFRTELLPPGYITALEQTLVQAAAEGIGVYFSSGDGDESTSEGYVTTDWPASSPWVTAVGGTALGVGASNDYHFEVGWGTHISTWDSKAKGWTPAPPGPFLYGLGGGAFRDVVPPAGEVYVLRNQGGVTSLRTTNRGTSLTLAPGWDTVTGLGTPNGATFIEALR